MYISGHGIHGTPQHSLWCVPGAFAALPRQHPQQEIDHSFFSFLLFHWARLLSAGGGLIATRVQSDWVNFV